jgi:uncharacterized protein YjbJ (UPF0337 family)
MDWNRVEGNWKQMKGAVKQQWGKLTDDDLTQINGSQRSSKGSSRSDMESPRMKPASRSTPGIQTRACNKRSDERLGRLRRGRSLAERALA